MQIFRFHTQVTAASETLAQTCFHTVAHLLSIFNLPLSHTFCRTVSHKSISGTLYYTLLDLRTKHLPTKHLPYY